MERSTGAAGRPPLGHGAPSGPGFEPAPGLGPGAPPGTLDRLASPGSGPEAPARAASADETCAWAELRALARIARSPELDPARPVTFVIRPDGRPIPAETGGAGPHAETGPSRARGGAALQTRMRAAVRYWRWEPGRGWTSETAAVRGPDGGVRSSDSDPATCALLDLYLPLCAPLGEGCRAVGHLGQSLDGHIATPCGDSCFVTGPENIRHLHRMRALSDAVLVGTETAACDDPRLTTRLVPGDNPIRVILDRRRRLPSGLRVFTDGAAETLVICDRALVGPGRDRQGQARVIGIPLADGGERTAPSNRHGPARFGYDPRGEGARTGTDPHGQGARLDLAVLNDTLAELGIRTLFVEGGGATVSAFLAAGLLDRLQIAVAPVLIGAGRPGVRIPAPERLADVRRPAARVFRMGADLLYDLDLTRRACEPGAGESRDGPLARIA